jgi:hypothetical protein
MTDTDTRTDERHAKELRRLAATLRSIKERGATGIEVDALSRAAAHLETYAAEPLYRPALPPGERCEPVAWRWKYTSAPQMAWMYSAEPLDNEAWLIVEPLFSTPTVVAGADRAAVIEEIVAERGRQLAKGYDARHDDTHDDGSIATAAAVYALHPFDWHLVVTERSKGRLLSLRDFWPWDWSQFEPADERRNLVRAGALIVAEIERIDRAVVDAGKMGEGK